MIPARWPYSPQIYQAFAAMQQAGFTVYCCGDRRAHHVLVAAYDWGGYMDVINIRGVDRVTAARLPTYDGLDIFAPSRAVWHYLGALEPAVTATLQLPPPDHRDAPATTYPAPVTLFVASHEQRPMTVAPGRHVRRLPVAGFSAFFEPVHDHEP
jgi:hypothetical protein